MADVLAAIACADALVREQWREEGLLPRPGRCGYRRLRCGAQRCHGCELQAGGLGLERFARMLQRLLRPRRRDRRDVEVGVATREQSRRRRARPDAHRFSRRSRRTAGSSNRRGQARRTSAAAASARACPRGIRRTRVNRRADRRRPGSRSRRRAGAHSRVRGSHRRPRARAAPKDRSLRPAARPLRPGAWHCRSGCRRRR